MLCPLLLLLLIQIPFSYRYDKWIRMRPHINFSNWNFSVTEEVLSTSQLLEKAKPKNLPNCPNTGDRQDHSYLISLHCGCHIPLCQAGNNVQFPRTAKLNPVDQQNHKIYFPFTTLHFYKRGYSYIFRFKKLWNFLNEHVCNIFSTTVQGAASMS